METTMTAAAMTYHLMLHSRDGREPALMGIYPSLQAALDDLADDGFDFGERPDDADALVEAGWVDSSSHWSIGAVTETDGAPAKTEVWRSRTVRGM